MKKSLKVFIMTAYFAVGITIVAAPYLWLDGFISKPWQGILSATAALLINETLGRYLLRRLWGIDWGGIFGIFKKDK